MELLNDIFPIIIYFLVAVLLFVIIILITKLISTVEKVNVLLDDVEDKSQKLNGLFDAIEKVGDTIKSANSKVSGLVAKLVSTVFKQKKKRSKKEEVEDDE